MCIAIVCFMHFAKFRVDVVDILQAKSRCTCYLFGIAGTALLTIALPLPKYSGVKSRVDYLQSCFKHIVCWLECL